MPQAYTCTLHVDDMVQFPDQCVMCGKAHPGATHRYTVRQGLSLSRIGSWWQFHVPCCKRCGWRLDIGRVLRGARVLLITAAVAGPAAWLLYHYTSLREPALGWAIFGFICAGIMVGAVWEIFHPPEFALEVAGKTVSFHFRSRERAEEFAAANGLSYTAPPPNE